jgi:hypothetical protein
MDAAVAEAKRRLATTFTLVGVTEVYVGVTLSIVLGRAPTMRLSSLVPNRWSPLLPRSTDPFCTCVCLPITRVSRYVGSIWLASRVFGWGDGAVIDALAHPVSGFRTGLAEKRKAVPFAAEAVDPGARADVEAKEACDVAVGPNNESTQITANHPTSMHAQA